MQQDDPRVRHAKDVADLAKAIYQNMVAQRGQPMDRQQQNTWMTIAHEKAAARFSQYRPGAQPSAKPAAGFPSQSSEYRRSRDIDNFESVAEAFDQPYKTKTEKSEYGDVDVLAKLPDGTNLSIMFNHEGDNEWQVEFYRDNSQEVTGQGDAQRIFATVLAAIQKFVKKYQPDVIKFSAEKSNNSDSRSSLYDRLVSRFAQQLGYNNYSEEYMSSTMYELSKQSQGVAEEQLDELSFLGSECTKDCSGHRAGYDWSKRKGLRQANSWSPSFNKGAGLAVAGK
jgi:hypothetical protein